MAAASINEETHRETQQTRTETQEKQRKSFISDRAEWSEARPPLTQRPQGPCYKPRAQMHIHPHTHTHMHRQTDTHQIHEDTRRHAKSLSLPSGRPAKKDSYCFALPVHLLRQVSKSSVFPCVLQCFLQHGGSNFNMLSSWTNWRQDGLKIANLESEVDQLGAKTPPR